MQPTYSADAEVYRQKVHAFLAEKLPTNWAGTGRLDGDALTEFVSEWRVTLYEAGYLAPGWPVEYGGAGLSALDLASNYGFLSEKLRQAVQERVDDEYGLEIPALFIVNISVPEEVERALDACSSMSVIGDLSKYQQYQIGQSLPTAAANPAGGLAGAGLGMGMGMAAYQQMTPQGTAVAPAPPPMPSAVWHYAEAGRQEGPLPVERLVERIAAGTLSRTTLVWSPGMATWQPAGDVTGLQHLFPPSPPPIG